MVRSVYTKTLKHKSQNVTLLKDELSGLLKELKTKRKEVFGFWEDVVGEKIAKIAIPVKNKNGILYIKVEDSVWRFELTRNKNEIIKKIGSLKNKVHIRDIVFI